MPMSPVYIVCHADREPAGYLYDYLDKNNVLYKKINGISDDLTKLDLTAVSGLVFMGGPFSVNDDLKWINDEIKWIQKAIETDTPLMGVCFGAQLITKALGADVYKSEQMEAGWHDIIVDNSKLADIPGLNLDDTFEVFEWHEDTFSTPDDALPLFSGHNFENQGYLIGKILTMQFHLEMTEQMVHEWLQHYCDCMPRASTSVQSPEQIVDRLNERLDNLHAVADKIYGWWLDMVKLG